MKSISTKAVLLQLKADLIGKDSYRGVTLTYSWLANQVGHFSLGFIPTLFISVPLTTYTSINNIPVWSALIISITWLLFETYNFLGPLLIKKSETKAFFIAGKIHSFQPPWKNIAFDTFTDLCFFWVGTFSASLFLGFSNASLCVLITLLLILVYPIRYWYLTKMYLQSAQYPFQYRLSQWEGNMNVNDMQIIDNFISQKETGKHLFVFGAKGTGKTSISVGIGTEFSIHHSACLYTTAVKLFTMFFESDTDQELKGTQLWTWRKASLLVIDDINPGDPIKDDIVVPDNFLKILDTFSISNAENRTTLKNKNVIWVLGDKMFDDVLLNNWKQMLMKIGVENKNVSAINLL